LSSLIYLVLKTFSFGKRISYAGVRGDIKKGISYALGKGMMPWEKESTKKHLLTYIAGIIYHLGIFSGFYYLLSIVIPFDILFLDLIRILLFSGLFCGLAMLIKRIVKKDLRKISCPDDFFSNIIVDIFILFVFIDTFLPKMRPLLFSVSIILLLYIPAGKIRHCFFFFYTRILFGIFYGKRGTLPRPPTVKY
jgi:hypothetical protein